MMSSGYIYRSARLLIDRHGDQALGQAQFRVMSMRQDGNPVGEAVWQAILKAVVELQRTFRGAGEAEH